MKNVMKTIIEILEELHPNVDFLTELHLIDNHILHSFDIITLVAEIDDRFDIRIPAEELVPENFNSAKALADLIIHLTEGE